MIVGVTHDLAFGPLVLAGLGGTMVEDIPEIAELDLNPVFVQQHGAVVADVRIRLTG